MSNEDTAAKDQPVPHPDQINEHDQQQTPILPCQSVAKTTIRNAEKKIPATKLKPRRDSEKKVLKPCPKNSGTRGKHSQRTGTKEKASQRHKDQNHSESTSEEETSESKTENTLDGKTEKCGRNSKRDWSEKQESRSYSHGSFTLHKHGVRKSTGTLPPSELLLRFGEECANTDTAPCDDTLGDGPSENLSCSLANERSCQTELRPWDTCGSPVSHIRSCVQSELCSTSSKSSCIAQSKRKSSDTSQKTRQKRLYQSPFQSSKWWTQKNQSPYLSSKLITGTWKSLMGYDSYDYPHMGMSVQTVGVRGDSDLNCDGPSSQSFPGPCKPREVRHFNQYAGRFKVKRCMLPSPLYSSTLAQIVRHSTFKHESEPPEISPETENQSRHESSQQCSCSAPTASDNPIEDYVTHKPEHSGKKTMPGSRQSLWNKGMPDSGTERGSVSRQEQHVSSAEERAKKEGCKNENATTQSANVGISKSVSMPHDKHASASYTQAVHLHYTEFSSTPHEILEDDKEKDASASLKMYHTDSSTDTKDICHQKTGKFTTIHHNQNQSSKEDSQTFPSSSTTNLHKICRTVSEPLGNMKLGANRAILGKDSFGTGTRKEKLDTRMISSGNPRQRKARKKRQTEDGNQPKKSLSEIFRTLREKGCLVNNCPKCSQESRPVEKSHLAKEQGQCVKSCRAGKSERHQPKERGASQGEKRLDGSKSKESGPSQAGSTTKCKPQARPKKTMSFPKPQVSKETTPHGKPSAKESPFETDQLKIMSDISLYLKLQKAIDTQCNMVKSVKEKTEHEPLFQIQHSLTGNGLESCEEQNQKCKKDSIQTDNITLEDLECVSKDRTQREQNTEKTQTVDSREPYQPAKRAVRKKVCDSEENKNIDIIDDIRAALRTARDTTYVPAPPPNSPVLRTRKQRRVRGRHLSQRRTKSEDPLHLAKIELYTISRSGHRTSKPETMMGIGSTSTQPVMSRPSVVNMGPVKLNIIQQKRLMYFKAFTAMPRPDGSPQDEGRPTRTSFAARSRNTRHKPLLIMRSAPTVVNNNTTNNKNNDNASGESVVSMVAKAPAQATFRGFRARPKVRSCVANGNKPRSEHVTPASTSAFSSTPNTNPSLAKIVVKHMEFKASRELNSRPCKPFKRATRCRRQKKNSLADKQRNSSSNCCPSFRDVVLGQTWSGVWCPDSALSFSVPPLTEVCAKG